MVKHVVPVDEVTSDEVFRLSQRGRQSEQKVNIRNTEYVPTQMMAPRTLEPGTLMLQH